MRIWSTNPDGTYSLNLSNEHGPCTVTLNNDSVRLEYDVNNMPFTKTWPIEDSNPDVQKHLALIPILAYVSNKETESKCVLNKMVTVPPSFDEIKAMIQKMDESKPDASEYINEIKTKVEKLDVKLNDAVKSFIAFHRTEIKFHKAVRHDIEEILDTPLN